MVESESKVL